jgi:hypothetical protein
MVLAACKQFGMIDPHVMEMGEQLCLADVNLDSFYEYTFFHPSILP